MEARLNLSFLLEYLRSLAYALFQRKASRDLDVKIVTAGSSHTLAFFFFFFFVWFFFGCFFSRNSNCIRCFRDIFLCNWHIL